VAKSQSVEQKRKAQTRGRLAEIAAAVVLTLKGYRILARRFRCPVGEIDIIARRFGTVVFVEVKARSDFEQAAHAVSGRQQTRIVRAAEYWVMRQTDAAAADRRFDVMLVGTGLLCRHIKHAFTADAVLGQ